jgi:glycosyltransferase involved in cell wall biosynthesis
MDGCTQPRQLKILLVAHGVTDQSLLGGPGRVAAAQANALAQRGHEVTVVTTDVIAKGRRVLKPTFGLLDTRVKIHCLPAYTLRSWPGTLGPIFHPRSKRLLTAAVRAADVVHCHEWPYHLIQQARSLSREQGKRCIIQPHGSIQARRGVNRMIHALFALRYSPRSFDVFIAGTPGEEAELAAVSPNANVHRVVNPMTIPEDDLDGSAAATRRSWGFNDDATLLLYGHRIYPNKGLDLLIQATELLPPSLHLAVVGDVGDTRFAEECSRLVTQLGLSERVRFFAPVGRNDINRVLRACDIFVLPARKDTFPLMVLHAMACSRPVVVTKTCQIAELLRDAVAVAEPTPAGLADRIQLLLDPVERATLGRRGCELIRNDFGPSAVAKKLEQIYRGDH